MNTLKKAYDEPFFFIGIGGSGMCPLAEIAIKKGYTVYGSDTGANSNIQRLIDKGARIFNSHNPKNLCDTKTVIYSSAIKKNNSEFLAGNKSGRNVIHRSDFLNYLMQDKETITISGMHGKTTTTAMISHILLSLKFEPTIAVGGYIKKIKGSSWHGNGKYFVAEADESDGSFLKYKPNIGVVTNYDLDHLDYYKCEKNIVRAFKQHIDNINPEGTCIAGEQFKSPIFFHKNILYFGKEPSSHARILSIYKENDKTLFDFSLNGKSYTCKLRQIGSHNVYNALASLLTTYSLGIDIQEAIIALESFEGVERRLTILYNKNKLKIYDDYAHNPGKIKSLISSLKNFWHDNKLVIIFQAHRLYRLKTMYEEFLDSFRLADEVIVLPLHNENEIDEAKLYTPEILSRDISRVSRINTHHSCNFTDAATIALSLACEPTVIVTIGAGDVWKVGKIICQRLELNDKKNAEKPSFRAEDIQEK